MDFLLTETAVSNKLYQVKELYRVARNPNTSQETLTLLASDKDSFVRYCVAENSNTPPETLTFLASDGDCNVRLNAAHNPNTPPKTLTFLAKDGVPAVRFAAKQNRSNKQKSYIPVPQTSWEFIEWAEKTTIGELELFIQKSNSNVNIYSKILDLLTQLIKSLKSIKL